MNRNMIKRKLEITFRVLLVYFYVLTCIYLGTRYIHTTQAEIDFLLDLVNFPTPKAYP